MHTAQLMPLPLTVSCSSKIQIGFTFLVPAHLGSPGQRAVKRMYVRSSQILVNNCRDDSTRKSRKTQIIKWASVSGLRALLVPCIFHQTAFNCYWPPILQVCKCPNSRIIIFHSITITRGLTIVQGLHDTPHNLTVLLR